MNKEEAKTMLPWFAAGALETDEARAVEAHLLASPELRQELAELRVLQHAVSDVADSEPVFRPALINDALRQIDEYEATRPASASPNLLTPGLFTQAIDWLRETLVGGWVRAPSGARLAMVAQFALILVLGGVLMMPTGPGTESDPVYSTAAVRPADGAADAAGTAIAVIFQPMVTEQQMRELLTDVDGEIVAGPSAGGSYTIRVQAESDPDVTQVLDTLRSNPDAVRFATKSE